ncbi:hypothetical protein PhaeoP14_00146 [Phaeobacter piscinae]|nr:hypothetical protein PhaeoP14_00146 [Phaeobacter piscinae]
MILMFIGLISLFLVFSDFLLTTVAITDRKLPSRWVAQAAWNLMKRLLPINAFSRIAVGPIVMASIAVFWVIGTALAWFLIFQGSERSVVLSDTRQPAGLLLDLGYVGEALSTLGGGNTKPGSAGWELVTVLVGVNGMIVLTLSVSFVLNTTQTVAAGRAFLTHLAARQELGGELTTELKHLADLVSSLNSVPHALYYSTPAPHLRLPEGLLRFTADWLEHKRNLKGVRTVLRDLPNFTDQPTSSDDVFLKRLAEWSSGFEFKRPN